jgi:hypothetical protein
MTVINRSSQQITAYIFDNNGSVYSVSTSVATIVGQLPVGFRAMLSEPGTVSALGFKKGVGIAPSAAEALALSKGILAGLV